MSWFWAGDNRLSPAVIVRAEVSHMQRVDKIRTATEYAANELCECGHSGAAHDHEYYCGAVVAPHHGGCRVCACGQFTWKCFIDERAAAFGFQRPPR